MQAGHDLPPRCIICNAHAETPITSTNLFWHSPWYYLLAFVNILLYIVVGLLARKSFKVSPGLCSSHAAQRKRRLLGFFGIGGAAAVAAMTLLAGHQGEGAIALFALALLLVTGMLATRRVYARKITKEQGHIGGCKEPSLASLE